VNGRVQPDTLVLLLRTLRIGFEATAIAAAIGVPLGVALGAGRFRGRRVALATFNAGLRVPPVALGQVLWILLWPASQWGGGPLGGLGWIYTLDAVILAQALLALPVVVALTTAAVQGVPGGLLAQARAYGARRIAVGRLALREARVGVLAALIAALGTAMASVGAVLVVGSQVNASTLPSAALTAWNQGDRNAEAVAYGTTMLGLFLIVAAALTVAQHGQRPRWLPVRS
jgi:tungstate transport system permease protein